ncbi:MAG: PadR family transcriptional regulator [Sulfolobales archaeon]
MRRRYRDDLKMMILDLLEGSPYHTYALMKKLEEVIGFKPPLSMLYSIMRSLYKEGLVYIEVQSRGEKKIKIYRLTEQGHRFLKDNSEKVLKARSIIEKHRRFREIGAERVFQLFKELYMRIDSMSPSQIDSLRNVFTRFERDLRGILEGVEG